MIEVEHLRKIYGDTVAVDDLSFGLAAGEILGFLGPNGAGKTTTMRILTGYTPATAGTVCVAGYDMATQPERVRAILGYLPESAPVYPEMTVQGYVDFFAEVKGLVGDARREAVGRALDECGLGKVGHRLLMNLSKGYRQRAALAQAVVGDPRLLVLDEPTVGLDPEQIREIRSLIRRMAHNRTVVLSTHILPEVSLTCTRVLIIKRGRVVADGTPENVHGATEAPNTVIVHVRGYDVDVMSTLSAVPGVSDVKCENSEAEDHTASYRVTTSGPHDRRADLARAVVGAGFDLLEIRATNVGLEEIFLNAVASGDEAPALAAGRGGKGHGV